MLAAAVHVAVALPRSNVDRGDHVQNAIPALGAVCAVAGGGLAEYAWRFGGSMLVVHGLKNGLGPLEINRRPRGGDRGFPSGHTAAAAYGASYLVRECAGAVPYVGPLAVLAAGFVAGSRIEGRRHDLGQVMAGAVIGLVADLSFRLPGSRAAVRRIWRAARRRLRWLIAAPAPA
jgi:membrane-associated phospholipid phosphatase